MNDIPAAVEVRKMSQNQTHQERKLKMNMTRLMLVAALVAGAIGSVRGGMYEWTGEGADWYWTTPENWKGGKVPGTSDIAVFDPGEGKSFSVGFSAVETTIVKSLRILSGTTTFGTTKYVYLGNVATNEVYVATDATFVSSNVFMFANKKAFLKTGGGTALFNKSFHKERYDNITDIREGTLRIGADYDDKATIGSTNIVIRSGATLELCGPNAFINNKLAGAACLNIEEGGKVRYGGYNDNTAILSSINGAGTFEIGGRWNTVHNLKLTGKMGPSRFCGKFLKGEGKGGVLTIANEYSVPEDQMGFVVGAADTLAGLAQLNANEYVRFASGVGTFNAQAVQVSANKTLTLEDEAGKPVTLAADITLKANAQIAGTGRIVTPSALSVGAAGGAVSSFEATVPTLKFTADNADVMLAAGRYYAKGTDTLDDGRIRPAGVQLGYSAESNLTTGKLTVLPCADLTLDTGTGGYGLKEVDVAGGTVRLPAPYCAAPNVTADDPSVLKLNGGTVVVHYKGKDAQNLLDANDKVVLGIGEGGGTLTAEGLYDSYQYDNIRLAGARSAVNEGTDGGMTLEGCITWFVDKPFTFNGLSRIRGTLALIHSANALVETSTFFGAGDVELDSCAIGYHKQTFPTSTGKTCTLRLATADGKKLTANGAPVILLQGLGGDETRFSSLVPQNVEIGELAFKPGALLVVSDYSGLLGTAGNSSVKVLRNAPSVSPTSDRVLAPVLLSTGSLPKLLSYDADAGFCKLENTVSEFAGAEGKVISRGYNDDVTLNANTAYAADGVVLGEYSEVTFGSGSTLTVGDGTSPAIVAISGTSGLLDWNGKGAVDFGTSPGYLVIGAVKRADTRATVNVKIRSARTMTFASYPDYASSYRCLDLSGANTYEGDTYVSDIILYAKSTGCFSTGTVHVTGGQFAGGNIAFAASGTWANDFELSGWGFFATQYGGNDQRGAFSFQAANSVISGKVELKGDVRISSAADKKGTLTGVVSGDKLRVINSRGTIVLANDNTYTGGTEVISSELTLGKGASAGTGLVLLDNGVLRFENEEPATFANDMTGVGSVKLQGTAPVVFRGRMVGLDASLDLCGTSQPFTELPPFATIKNSSTKKATISLAENLGTVEWGDCTLDGKISLDIGEGTVLDLGGRTLNVYRLEKGAIGKVVNGTVNEEKPLAGIVLIVR